VFHPKKKTNPFGKSVDGKLNIFKFLWAEELSFPKKGLQEKALS